MADLNGYEIWRMASEGTDGAAMTEAADVSTTACTRIQMLHAELVKLTTQFEAVWQGRASHAAQQAARPITEALQQVGETLDKTSTSLRGQAENYTTFRRNVVPMATPQPPELTLWDQVTPWDTDNELAIRAWHEADAHNRQAYAGYLEATGQNQAVLPTMSESGGGQGANTAVQSTSGPGVRPASATPPQGQGGGTTPSPAPSSTQNAGGDKAAEPPSMSGGGKGSTAASKADGGDKSTSPSAQTPTPTPMRPGGSTAVADVPSALPVMRPPSANDTAHRSKMPKPDHLAGMAGIATITPGIPGTSDTRRQRGSLVPGERAVVVGRPLPSAPAAARAGAAGVNGVSPLAAQAREEEDREHKRATYLSEEPDAIVGELPRQVSPVIGED